MFARPKTEALAVESSMNRMLFPALLLPLLALVTLFSARGEDLAATSSLVYNNGGTPLGILQNLYGDRAWEIRVLGRYGPHLGSFRVGDSIRLSLSIGPVGEKPYARSKNFGRGNSPMPLMVIYADGKPGGKVLRTYKFNGGGC